jgi:hypothetical protein
MASTDTGYQPPGSGNEAQAEVTLVVACMCMQAVLDPSLTAQFGHEHESEPH